MSLIFSGSRRDETSEDSKADPARFVLIARRALFDDLIQGVMRGDAFLALTGPPASGKTTMAAAIHAELLNRSICVTRVGRGQSDKLGLRSVTAQMLGKPDAELNEDDIERLFDLMFVRRVPDQRFVVVIDDAELLQADVLEYFRLISGMPMVVMPQVILVGRPGLWHVLDNATAINLAGMITARWELAPLRPDEARTFIEQSLASVGLASTAIFDAAGLEELVRQSDGSFGSIFALLSLATAMQRGFRESHVTAGLIAEAASRLNAEPARSTEPGEHACAVQVDGGVLAGPSSMPTASPGPARAAPEHPGVADRARPWRRAATAAGWSMASFAIGAVAYWSTSLQVDRNGNFGLASLMSAARGLPVLVRSAVERVARIDAGQAAGRAEAAVQPTAKSQSDGSRPVALQSAMPDPSVPGKTTVAAASTAPRDGPAASPSQDTPAANPDPLPGAAIATPTQSAGTPTASPAAPPEGPPVAATIAAPQTVTALDAAAPDGPADRGATGEPALNDGPIAAPLPPTPTQAAAIMPGEPPPDAASGTSAAREASLSHIVTSAAVPVGAVMAMPPPAAPPPLEPAQAPTAATGAASDVAAQRAPGAAPSPAEGPVGSRTDHGAGADAGAVAAAVTQMRDAPPESAPPVAAALRPTPADPTAAALLQRGDAMFALRDISAARRLYAGAASLGSGPAATALGKTYDPAFLETIGAIGIKGDPTIAAAWYRKAIAAGDRSASGLLAQLNTGGGN